MGKGELDLIMALAKDIETGKHDVNSICIKNKEAILKQIDEAMEDEAFAFKGYQSLSSLIGRSVTNSHIESEMKIGVNDIAIDEHTHEKTLRKLRTIIESIKEC